MPTNKPIENDIRFASPVHPPAGDAMVGELVVTTPDNQLLAGYLAHEFLTRGTLFGNRLRTSGAEEARPAKRPRLENREKHAEAPAKETRKVYVEVARLLREEGLHLPDEDAQKEIQIGLPTDVKHVAHIGWDGPSATPPSWMDEFRSQNGGYQSAPLDGCVNNAQVEDDEDSQENGGATESTVAKERSVPGLPRISRRHVSMDNISLMDSPVGSPTSHLVLKPKDKDSKNSGSRRRKDKSSKKKEASNDDEASSQSSLPKIPKKARKKKLKDLDASVKSSSKPSSKRGGTRNGSIPGSEDGAISSSAASSGLAVLLVDEH